MALGVFIYQTKAAFFDHVAQSGVRTYRICVSHGCMHMGFGGDGTLHERSILIMFDITNDAMEMRTIDDEDVCRVVVVQMEYGDRLSVQRELGKCLGRLDGEESHVT